MGCFNPYRNKINTNKAERRLSFFFEVCKGLTQQEKEKLRELDDKAISTPGPTKDVSVSPMTIEARD